MVQTQLGLCVPKCLHREGFCVNELPSIYERIDLLI